MIDASRLSKPSAPLPERLPSTNIAEEMIAVFREADADAHNGGTGALAKLYLREVTGLSRGAMAEHARCILGTASALYILIEEVHHAFRFPFPQNPPRF